MFRPRKAHPVGLDIGSTSVKAICLQQEGSVWHLRDVHCRHLPPVAPDAEPGAADLILIAELAAVRGAGKRRLALISVPSRSGVVRRLSLPYQDDASLAATLHLDAERYIASDTSHLYIAHQPLSVAHEDPETMEVLLAAVRREVVDERVALCRDAGLQVRIADVECLALFNALEFNYPEAMAETVATVLIGESGTTLSIVHEGTLAVVRDLTMGARALAEELGRMLGAPIEEASRLLMEPEASAEASLSEARASILRTWCIEIRRTIDLNSTLSPDQSLQRFFLSGLPAGIPGLAAALEAECGAETLILDPLRGVALSDEQVAEVAPFRCGLAVAVGLALRAEEVL